MQYKKSLHYIATRVCVTGPSVSRITPCVPTPSTPHRSPLLLSACLIRSSPCILHTRVPIPCPCPCLWIALARKKVVPHCACRRGLCAVRAVEWVRATTSSRIQPLLDRVHTCRYSKRRMQKQVGMWGLLLMSESERTSGWCCVRCALSLAHGCYKPFFTATQPTSLYA